MPESDRLFFDALEALEYPELSSASESKFVTYFEFFEHYEGEDEDFVELMLAMGASDVAGLISGDDYRDFLAKSGDKKLFKTSLFHDAPKVNGTAVDVESFEEDLPLIEHCLALYRAETCR